MSIALQWVNINKKLQQSVNLKRIVLSTCSEYCSYLYQQGVDLRTILQFPHRVLHRLNQRNSKFLFAKTFLLLDTEPEWQRLEVTSREHLLQPPCSSRDNEIKFLKA